MLRDIAKILKTTLYECLRERRSFHAYILVR